MTAAPAIRTDRLSRFYGEVIGLNDVTVEVPPGITGLLGPNGAGKSTFLRLVSGEIRPSAGRIEVLGHVPFANPEVHRRIGYCPEGDRFFDDMEGLAFLAFLLRLSGAGRREARERAGAALAEVGMERAADLRLSTLSKGMRQRLKIAAAIAHDPELLLLDEPLSGLDPVARHETQALIRRRAAAGASVLVSSHVLSEVEAVTDHVLFVSKGRIAATGRVAEIRSLLDREPRRVRVETSDPRALGLLLLDRADVRSLRFEPGVLLVETAEPDRIYDVLPDAVLEHGIEIHGLTSPDEKLQTVFDLLVGGAS